MNTVKNINNEHSPYNIVITVFENKGNYGTANVLYKVGENGYTARVIVGLKEDGSATLYDLVSIKSKIITEAPAKDKRTNLPSSVDASVNISIPRGQAESQNKVHRIIMPDGAEFSFENINRDIAERAPGKKDSSLSPADNISTHSIPRGQAESQDKLSLTESQCQQLKSK